MDEDAADRRVLHPEGGSFTVLHGKVHGGIIQLEALRTLDLHRVVGSILQGQEHPAVSVCGHGVHRSAVHAPDLKRSVGDALPGVVRVDLDDLHAADGVVIHRDGLGFVGVDDHRLGAGLLMDSVALDGLGLCDEECPHQTVNDDLAVFVSAVEAHAGGHAAVVVHHRAVRLGDGKLYPLQGLMGDGIQLVDDKAALGLVEHFQGVGLVVFHGDGLGGIVQQVSALGLYLLDDIGTRFQAGDRDIAVAVSTVFPVGGPHRRAVCGCHLEGHIGQGLLGHAVHLLNEQAALGGVGDDHRLGVSALSDDHIGGGGIHDVPLGRLDLREHVCAGGQIGGADLTAAVSGKHPVLGQGAVTDHPVQAHFAPRRGRDAELGAGQGLTGHAVPFLDN